MAETIDNSNRLRGCHRAHRAGGRRRGRPPDGHHRAAYGGYMTGSGSFSPVMFTGADTLRPPFVSLTMSTSPGRTVRFRSANVCCAPVEAVPSPGQKHPDHGWESDELETAHDTPPERERRSEPDSDHDKGHAVRASRFGRGAPPEDGQHLDRPSERDGVSVSHAGMVFPSPAEPSVTRRIIGWSSSGSVPVLAGRNVKADHP